MFTRLHPFRIVAAVLAALLLVGGLQGVADAATKRSVSIKATPTADAVRTSVTFAGNLTHSPKHSLVVIERKSGKKWVKVSRTKTTTAAGAYSVRLTRPSAVAAYSYRAYSAKTRKLKAATSKAITVYALTRAFASLTAAPTKLTVDSNVTLAGNVFPFIAGTPVLLQRKSGSSWLNVAATSVTAKGTFSKPVLVTVGGTTTYRGIVSQAKSYAPTTTNTTSLSAKPLILSNSLAAAVRLTTYSVRLLSYGGVAGTWTAAPLPAGLTLNASTGVISGKPTATGDTQVVVGFTQTGNSTPAATKTLTLRVSQAAVPVITTTALPTGSKGHSYNATLAAQGTPAGTWTAAPLPAGLTLNGSTGVISGTPTAAFNSPVMVGFTQTDTGLAATPQSIPLVISGDPVPVIMTTTLPIGSKGATYGATLTAQGTPTGTWTAAPLPDGLTLDKDTGVISGTPSPTAATDTNVVIGFTDTATGLSAEPVTITLQIDPGANPVISTSSLPDGTRLNTYSLKLTTVGTAAGTWTAAPLPAGLTLNGDTISGTPTATGDTQVTIEFTEADNNLTASKTLNLHIAEAMAPVISTTGFTDAHQFLAYTATLTANGSPAGTWTAAGLPTGLTLDKDTGIISGTPTVSGSFPIVVGFTQTSTGLAAAPTTLTLNVVAATPPEITTTSLPDGTRTLSYSTTLTSSMPGTWSVDQLPPGLHLDTHTGVISGTPTATGSTNVTVGFTADGTGLSTSKVLSLSIVEAPAPVISTAALPAQRNLVSYSFQLSVVGSPAGTWSATGLPSPLKIAASTGLISGGAVLIPATSNHTVTVKFTQTSTGLSTTKTFTLTSQGLL